MDIKIQHDKLNCMQLAQLQDLERLLKHTILDTLKDEKCKLLEVQFGCAIINLEKETYRIVHNASFSLQGSYSLVNSVNDILLNSNIKSIIPNHTLLIELDIRQKEKTKEKTSAKELCFVPVKPKYSFDQIILEEELKNEIFDAIKLIEVKSLVYNDWGYGAVEPVAKSILNLYGPPGTGKTMCAHAIANKLNMDLLALNYSEIESKYLGEAAKNLKKAFETAEKTGSVLFFDEADSFLGKRVQNVTQSSDQALNSLRSQMLILLEEHEGVVLFATNLVTNFDPAFNSRIQKHIHFELPNEEARAKIIEKQIPLRLPLKQNLTKEDFINASVLADGLSGREIKNAIFDMLLHKAEIGNDNIVFTASDICQAMCKMQDSIKKLNAERKKILKDKILRKFEEKAEEDKFQSELEQKKMN